MLLLVLLFCCFCWHFSSLKMFFYLRAQPPILDIKQYIFLMLQGLHIADFPCQKFVRVLFRFGVVCFFVFVLPSGCCRIIFLLNFLSDRNLVWDLLCRYRITAAFRYRMAWHSLNKVLGEYRASFTQKTVRSCNRRIYVEGDSSRSSQRNFGLSHCNTSLKWGFPQGRRLFNKVMVNQQNPFRILKCLFYRKHSVRKTYQLQLLHDRRQTYRYCRFIKTSSDHFLCRSNGSDFPCHNLNSVPGTQGCCFGLWRSGEKTALSYGCLLSIGGWLLGEDGEWCVANLALQFRRLGDSYE